MEQEKPTVPEVFTGSRVSANKKLFLAGLAGIAAVGVVVAIGVGIYRVYVRVATDRFTLAVATVFRLPAAKIDGQAVLYRDYVTDLKALTALRAYSQKTSNPISATDDQLSDSVLWHFATNIFVAKTAKEQGVTISPVEVDAEKSVQLQQFKSTEEAEKTFMEQFGWNIATYVERLLRPKALEDKLNKKITEDTVLRDEVKARAEGVLAKIKAGKDFALLAKESTEDGATAPAGEPSEWLSADKIGDEGLSQAIFSLKKGEVFPSVIETLAGYFIVKAEDVRMGTSTVVDAKTGKNKTVAAPQVRVLHILFRLPSLSTMLDSVAGKTDYHLYIPVHNPFTAAKTK